jgi:hypothetical protein
LYLYQGLTSYALRQPCGSILKRITYVTRMTWIIITQANQSHTNIIMSHTWCVHGRGSLRVAESII